MKLIKQISKAILLFCALFLLLGAGVRAERTTPTDEPEQARIVLCENEVGEPMLTYYIEATEHTFLARDAQNILYAERETLAELVSTLPSAHLIFREIRTDAPLSLTRQFSLSGTLTLPTLSIEGGAAVSMLGGTLTGELLVRNGSFLLSDGTILCQEGSAVTLDYMASAVFHMLGGRVASEKSPAIFAPVGSVLIGGGSVESAGECAVFTSATLTLYGSAVLTAKSYGVESTRALHLSYGGESFSGQVSVRMDTVFEKGSFSLVAHGASESSANRIKLLDEEGRAMPLTYFDESSQTKEERVLAVALPYELSFYSEGKLFEKLLLYEGELISPPTPPERIGFYFVGYHGEDGTLSDDERACEDGVFYADYALSAPTFSLSDLSFVYDGTSHTLGLENLHHPLMDEGYFSYTWYYNGEMLKESAPTLSVKNTSQSGRYRVNVSFTYKTESVSAQSEEITLTISPMAVAMPTLEDKTYDGTHLYATVPPSPYYTVKENEGGIGAGTYEVTLLLSDAKNTVWQGTSADTATVSFRIKRATNGWLSECWVRDAYLGKMPEFGGHGAFGESVLEYAKTQNGPYSTVLPGTAGVYFVRVRIAGCENYTELLSEPMQIELRENRVISIRIDSMPDKVSYTALETIDLSGISVSATYLDGSVLPVDVRSLYVIYDTYTSYLGGKDSGVTLAFGEARARLPLTVSRAAYNLDALSFSDFTATYTGASTTISPSGDVPLGRDGSRLLYRVEGEGINVGTYEIRLVFSSDSENYTIPEERRAILTIEPKKVEILWEMLTFVYDGSAKTPTASFINVLGEKVLAAVAGAQIKAGSSYTATASESSGNYAFHNPTVLFSIEKARYEVSGAYWSAESFIYDGTKREVTLLGLPEGVKVSAYKGNSATDAGEYTASATLSYDTENYHAPSVPDFTWRILRAAYDLSGFEVKGGSFVYDGALHYPEVSGALPKGHDGIAPTFTFSSGVREVSEGKCTAEVVFHTDSKNYEAPESLFAEIWITPAPVTVEWSNLSFTYDGASHLPMASHASLSLSVVGGGTNAGEYVASATSNDPNYYVKNAQITFVIQKAKNEWTAPLSVEDIFTSGAPVCSATAKHGEVRYLFYAEDGTQTELPQRAAGVYYCVATVAESENYLALTSERCRFLVKEVLPIALEATVSANACVAYRALSSEDISVVLVYNDGTRSPLTEYALSYQNGDSFRCKDTALTVTHGALSVSVPVSISPAALRIEDITLSSEGAVYTGDVITLSVISVPRGVTLASIDAPTLCNAGEYEILLHFTLDEENYEGDGTLVYRFVIEKKELEVPTLPDKVYNGTPYDLPDFGASAYEIIDSEIASKAGEYSVTLKVKDEENTCFSGGEATATVSYRITRAPLTVKLSELTVYADGYYDTPSYEITDGTLFSGDTLSFTPMVGETVGGTFENENYEITVIEGSVIRSELTSPDHQQKALLRFFLLVALLLFVLLIFSRRRSIRAYVKKHLAPRAPKAKAPTPVPTAAQPTPDTTVRTATAAAVTPTPVLALPSPSALQTEPSATPSASSAAPSALANSPTPSTQSTDATAQSIELPDEDGFQISFDFFENGERALAGRMMDAEEHLEGSAPINGTAAPSAENAGEVSTAPDIAPTEVTSAAPSTAPTEVTSAAPSTAPAEATREASATALADALTDNTGEGSVAPAAAPTEATSAEAAPRAKARQKKRTKKRKKRTARIKKAQAESMHSLLFAPWHKNGANHAERIVAHRCEESMRADEQSTEGFFGISPEEADRLLSDRSAESLVQAVEEPLVTYGRRKVLLYLDTIAAHFEAGECININTLKARAIIPYDTLHLKVLARGTLAKSLVVYATDFEMRAVKMLLLAGGKAIRQKTKGAARPIEDKA